MSEPASAAVGIVGVGSLGLAFAKNIMATGRRVVGYRRSAMDAFAAAGGTPARSPRAVAQAADVVLTCLPGAAAMDDVVAGPDGLAAGVRAGQIVVDLSTFDPADKERARQALAAAGAVMLDGAVSGNPFYVAKRQAVIFVGGDAAAFETARPVLEAATDTVRHVGSFGAGTALKLLASLLVPVHTLAAAEALQLGIRAGIAPEAIFEAIKGTQASSQMFETRGAAMVKRDYSAFNAALEGYYTGNVAMTRALAARVGGRYPLLEAMAALYGECVAAGEASRDQATIFEYLMRDRR